MKVKFYVEVLVCFLSLKLNSDDLIWGYVWSFKLKFEAKILKQNLKLEPEVENRN